MNEIDRLAIADRVHKFKHLELHFGQILYNKNVRKDLVFVLKVTIIKIRMAWFKYSPTIKKEVDAS